MVGRAADEEGVLYPRTAGPFVCATLPVVPDVLTHVVLDPAAIRVARCTVVVADCPPAGITSPAGGVGRRRLHPVFSAGAVSHPHHRSSPDRLCRCLVL